MDFLKELNHEKQEIVKTDGNVLVTANPGTGKTLLLAYKYAYLVAKGISAKNILCLTFTNKAKKELEERIIKQIKEIGLSVDSAEVNVHTFHSYALDYVDESEIVSSNMLRYAIYQYLKEKEILTYSSSYIIDTIVPKMDNLIRYLKNFGITPDKIDIEEVKKYLNDDDKNKKENLETFTKHFIDIYRYYEEIKSKKGIDYSDMLLKFRDIKNPPKFEYVLIDELQDVNVIEADMAISSGKYFVAVGDKKQAIFGFQGGSIINFEKFSNSKKFILSENFRSAQEILDYSRDFFLSKTKDGSYKEELKNLKNANGKHSSDPELYSVPREDTDKVVCELAKELSMEGKTVAIIARTNTQILKLSKALKERGMEHSSTFFSASKEAKDKMILFLKGILSIDLQTMKNSMFTPFFPSSVQESFRIAAEKINTFEEMLKLNPEFEKLRKSIKSLNDLKTIFEERVMPVSITYGREHLLAALNVQEALRESLEFLEDITLPNLVNYLESSDLLTDGSEIEKNIVLTSVHKAKGREYDNVIYLPTKSRDNSNFQDAIVEAILKSHGINAEEELEEEALRIDFVAFTRAKSKLCIVTEKPGEYLAGNAKTSEINVSSIDDSNFSERSKKAFNLFLNKEYEKAKELLEVNKAWIVDYIKNHFSSIKQISFSSLENSAFSYLLMRILSIKEITPSVSRGTSVHEIARKILSKENIEEIEEELVPYKNNIENLIKEIKTKYSEIVFVEEKIKVNMKEIIGEGEEVNFEGFIDAIFKNNDEYLIVDWKTDKNTNSASLHRQQLEAYKKAFSVRENIPLSNIKVAIGFVGLRKPINDNTIDYNFDNKQPSKTSIETFAKKVNLILKWKNDPESFFDDLKSETENSSDYIWRAVVEQYEEEKSKKKQN